MACMFKDCDDVGNFIFPILEEVANTIHYHAPLTKDTLLGNGGFGLDNFAKINVGKWIEKSIEKNGCDLDSTYISEYSNSKTIGDLIDIFCKDVLNNE